jgi:hypothetical protein
LSARERLAGGIKDVIDLSDMAGDRAPERRRLDDPPYMREQRRSWLHKYRSM